MKKLPVALQVYSVRDFAEKDLPGTLLKIKEMGYDYVEPAGLYENAPEAFRAALDEAGLKAICAHVPYPLLSSKTDETLQAYHTIGCEYIAIPHLDEKTRPGGENFANVVEEIKRIGAAAKALGMQLLYHNHDFEFKKMDDGRFGLDCLYESVPADLLQTEIDTCWVNMAGENPMDYVRKYTGRSPIVHLKDFHTTGARGVGFNREGFEFRPVGHGMQDMPAILQAALDAGAKYVVVEQDSSKDRPTLEAAKMSRDYLKAQGW